jgi:hypothetical protein
MCAAVAANQDLGDMNLATVIAKVPTLPEQLHFAKYQHCLNSSTLLNAGKSHCALATV